MPVCLDIRPLQTASKNAGIGTYCYNLIKNLVKIDPSQEYIFIKLKNYACDYSTQLSNDTVSFYNIYRPKCPQRFHTVYDYLLLNNLNFRNEVKLVHLTQPSSFLFKGKKHVVTLYDLIPLRYPQTYLRKFDVQKMYDIKMKMLSKCDKIICISNAVKDDAVSLLNIESDRLVVIPLGVDSDFYMANAPEAEKNSFITKFNIKKSYILNVGGMDYRKNVISAIRAFLVSNALYKDFQMVIVGRQVGAEYDQILNLIKQHSKSDLFVFTGILSLPELKDAYRGAAAFVYPSLYEGFGIPPLEAMASGVPVICSNTSSLPEVVGDAAIKVNPTDIEEISFALNSVIFKDDLRRKLIDEGKKHVMKFSWENTAIQTLKLYREIL